MKKFKSFAKKDFPQDKPYRVGIAHAKATSFAKEWGTELLVNLGQDKVFLMDVGTALGVHAGSGAIVFAIRILEDELNNE